MPQCEIPHKKQPGTLWVPEMAFPLIFCPLHKNCPNFNPCCNFLTPNLFSFFFLFCFSFQTTLQFEDQVCYKILQPSLSHSTSPFSLFFITYRVIWLNSSIVRTIWHHQNEWFACAHMPIWFLYKLFFLPAITLYTTVFVVSSDLKHTQDLVSYAHRYLIPYSRQFQGGSPCGSCGNSDILRMLLRAQKSITTCSSPQSYSNSSMWHCPPPTLEQETFSHQQ